jgi:outer membrane biosynthesis protein TonB
MSKLSIYQKSWNDLVFEGRNKEYGAYQLRQDASKTTTFAFLLGLLFIASLFALMALLSSFNKPMGNNEAPLFPNDTLVHVTKIEFPKPPAQPRIQPRTENKPAETSTERLLKDPIITEASQANNVSRNTDVKPNTTTSETGTSGTATATTTTSSTGTTETTEVPDNTVRIGATLDKMPELEGGLETLYKHVKKNFNNPETDEAKILKVYVSFVIEKDGSMTDIQVKRDPGYGLAKEAIRVLKSFKTRWEPGILNGKPVRTAYNLPITVQIN